MTTIGLQRHLPTFRTIMSRETMRELFDNELHQGEVLYEFRTSEVSLGANSQPRNRWVIPKSSLKNVATELRQQILNLGNFLWNIQNLETFKDASGETMVRIAANDNSLDILEGLILDVDDDLDKLVRSLEQTDIAQIQSEEECSICHEPYFSGNAYEVPVSVGQCGHKFGSFCIHEWCKSNRERPERVKCPMCRGTLLEDRDIVRLQRLVNLQMDALHEVRHSLSHNERITIAYARLRVDASWSAKVSAAAIKVIDTVRKTKLTDAMRKSKVQGEIFEDVRAVILKTLRLAESSLDPDVSLVQHLPALGLESRFVSGREVIPPEAA